MAIVICPDCGKEQDNLNKFCRNCGADLSKVEVVKEDIAGSPQGSDDSLNVPVLNEDGSSSNELVKTDIEDSKEEKVEEKTGIKDEGIVKCANCGTELGSNVKFCPNCGKPREDSNKTADMKFCPSCGTELGSNVKFCPYCGLDLAQSTVNPKPMQTVVEKKTPILSVLLSFLFPGLGQFYNGQSTKGLYFIILAIVSWILFIILIGMVLYLLVWLWSIFDAYQSAEAINKGEEIEDKLF